MERPGANQGEGRSSGLLLPYLVLDAVLWAVVIVDRRVEWRGGGVGWEYVARTGA